MTPNEILEATVRSACERRETVGATTTDRYVQAVQVQGPRGKWKVLRKYGPGVMDFAGPSKDGMTKADADELARYIAAEGTGFAYVKPEKA